MNPPAVRNRLEGGQARISILPPPRRTGSGPDRRGGSFAPL
jgi:hypothetical protein